ncbi:MAG: MgtC/SapB family protein, partial [Thiomonas arsenitoxydans]|nr:MgtC/SapB family protein [Thiomonas arsenitoxydans]
MIESSVLPWIAALGIGLLIGIERERSQPPESPAGLRSFVLAALAGATAGVLGPVALGVVLAAFALLTFAGYTQTRKSDPGLTTEFALLLTVLIGALAQQSPGWAAGLGVVVAGILAAKTTLHGFVRHVLSTQELESGLLLAAAALVVLPLLPDRPIAWLAGLNLHTLWLLAVLMMAI